MMLTGVLMSNDSRDDENSAINFFLDTVETQGVAVSSVTDGHVLMFKMSHLKQLISKYGDEEKLTIFVKHREFKN